MSYDKLLLVLLRYKTKLNIFFWSLFHLLCPVYVYFQLRSPTISSYFMVIKDFVTGFLRFQKEYLILLLSVCAQYVQSSGADKEGTWW